MQSHEVLKESVSHAGAKVLSSRLGISSSLLYKWCQPSDSPDASGSTNPLDRILRFCEATGETAPVEWLCEQCGGFFCCNPDVETDPSPFQMMDETRQIVREFSELLDAITVSLNDDQKLTTQEAGRIRREWEDLKRVGEGFVHACEKKTSTEVEN